VLKLLHAIIVSAEQSMATKIIACNNCTQNHAISAGIVTRSFCG